VDLALTDTSYSSSDQTWLVDPDYACKVGCTLDLSLFDSDTLAEWTSGAKGAIPAGLALGKKTSTGKFGPYAGSGNEVQTVTVVQGSPPGGTWTYTLEGETSAGIAPGASAATVKTAIVDSMSNIGVDDIDVSKSGDVYTLTLKGRWAGVNVPAGSVTDSTTGTGHGVTIAQTTAGGSTASDGTETFAGILWDDVPFTAGATTGNLGASRIVLGAVYLAKLPIDAGNPGGVDALAQANTAVKIAFV